MATNFPTPQELTRADLAVGEMKGNLANLVTAARQLPGGDTARLYTLTGTSFTPLGCDCVIDLPDGVDSGRMELATLNTMGEGRWLRLRKARSDIRITLVSQASALSGRFSLPGGDTGLNENTWLTFSLVDNVWTNFDASIVAEDITTSGDFIVSLTGKWLVELVGGGGAGGSSYAPSGILGGASGGSSGCYVQLILELTAGEIVPCTIGAPGIASTNPASPHGGNGGNTSFGNYGTAQGGLGGAGVPNTATYDMYPSGRSAQGPGGNPGGQGGHERINSSSGVGSYAVSGLGGASLYGMPGAQVSVVGSADAVAGQNAQGFGAGGGGAASNRNNTAGARGGNGAPGLIKLRYLGA